MSSDESDEGSIIDCDTPRPPYLLVQDAYQVSRDFYNFLRKGVEDGSYREWPCSLIDQLGCLKDSQLYQWISAAATGEGSERCNDRGLLNRCKFNEHLNTLKESANSIASQCSERYAAVKGRITQKLPSRSAGSTESQSRLPTIKENISFPQLKLACPSEESSATPRTMSSIRASDTSAARRQSIIEIERKASLVRREVRDFISDLSHSRTPDYPRAFYLEGDGSAGISNVPASNRPTHHNVPEPPPAHIPQTHGDAPAHQTIVLQPKVKPSQDRVVFGRVMSPKPAEIPKDEEPQPEAPVQAKIRNIPVRMQEPASVQKDFSQSQSYGERFRQPSPQAQPVPTAPVPVVPAEPYRRVQQREPVGGHHGSPTIEDSLSRFQQEVRRLEQAVPQAPPGPVNFTTVPAPFSQVAREYDFPSLGVSQHKFEGKASPVSPKHDPAHSAFTPPLRSSPVVRKDHPNYPRMATDFGDGAPPKAEAVVHIPKVSTKFRERWKADEPPVQDPHNVDRRAAYGRHEDIPIQGVAKIRGEWPPPSNAVGAELERDIFQQKAHGGGGVPVQRMHSPGRQKYSRKREDHEEPEMAVEEPRHEPPPPPAPRPTEPSPERGRSAYQPPGTRGTRTRAFSPVLWSAPRPFSPTYDYTPKLNFNMSRSFDPHHHSTQFGGPQSFMPSGQGGY